ncbi:Solute carrier 22 member 2 [Clonorchis sinensis]|uniref:Solute carrier 22 member 2 n=1 Tax=Clonorchis sinensis TaxID=79923 RepID=A0A419PLX9_CLOSI|nr:Solute carrier 22 member 2 [Clonorchis sinensis]
MFQLFQLIVLSQTSQKLSTTAKRMLDMVPTFHVDTVLEKIVGPCGLWQWSIAVLLAVSTASLSTFPVFANSFSPHRCRMEDSAEEYFAAQNFKFDYVASRIGPWYTNAGIRINSVGENDIGCVRYQLDWSRVNLIAFFDPNSTFVRTENLTVEQCPLGYVHQESAMHYPGNVIIDFDTRCAKSWLAPLGTSVYMLGMLFGFIFGGWFGDRFGRRPTLLGFSIFELCCGVWTCLSPNYVSYVLARFLMAIGNTAQINVSSVLVIELTVARYRSVLTAPLSLGINFIHRGLMAFEAYMIPQWRWLHLAVMSPNFLSVLYFFYLPESPRWLVANNRPNEAIKVLQTGCRVNKWKSVEAVADNFENVLPTAEGFDNQIGDQTSRRSTDKQKSVILKPFSTPRLAKTTLLCCFIVTGIVMSFFGLLLYASEVRTIVYLAAFWNASSSVPAILLSSLIYRYTKRRRLPLACIIGLSSFTLIFGGLFTTFGHLRSDLLLTVCSNIALVLLNSSLCMCYVYVPELFPSDIRTNAFGTVLGLARIGSIICSFVNELDRYVKHGVPLLVYSIVLVVVWLSIFLMQDTSGENLPDRGDEKPSYDCTSITQPTDST